MAWTTPPTWVSGQPITSAFLNALRDNLLETSPAKATSSGTYFAGTGSNSIAERFPTIVSVGTSETTTSTSFTDLASPGPAVTVATGTKSLVLLSCSMSNNTVNGAATVGTDISGSHTAAATTSAALHHVSSTAGAVLQGSYVVLVGMAAGTSTFTLKYQVSVGTGTFSSRRLTVLPF